ncbi:hypothetical protein CAEBREN_07189 [Caenorhabditis brenneri]|uniref:Uncharacterized protein n=1 Tax=Caenorhabditis brenneri TaxID=135651 RepID=G0NYR4_CAEBE|nr:hypothetical protein CAEBREN_07189 [Caenorhabditis brenneri]
MNTVIERSIFDPCESQQLPQLVEKSSLTTKTLFKRRLEKHQINKEVGENKTCIVNENTLDDFRAKMGAYGGDNTEKMGGIGKVVKKGEEESTGEEVYLS